jgi:3-hydroxyisobutyrate dehydrogenase
MSTIVWIGLGHMGHPMSQHMRKAGYVVRGVDIDPAAAERARRDGIEVVDTVAEACKGVDAVFTMLPAGPDVKKVLTGPDGVFASVPAKAVVVDCSTIGIEYALEIHKAADQAGRGFVEAPVSGGTEGAVAGTLTFMLGGEEKYKDRVTTLLEPMGSFISYVGGAGAGQAAKVVNNLIMGVSVTVNCEAMDLAQRLDLDLKAFFEIVKHSSGDNWSFRLWNPAPGMVPEAPSSHGYKAGFKTWLLAKDLGLALEAGRNAGVRLATAEGAHERLLEHAHAGGADQDATSLIELLSVFIPVAVIVDRASCISAMV